MAPSTAVESLRALVPCLTAIYDQLLPTEDTDDKLELDRHPRQTILGLIRKVKFRGVCVFVEF